ncbi:lysophospholipid acyltransferase family protein [Ectothiorhodospiraceae bacterium 2226]|nr:lysophospholipid acyltransferase family protein [Ectothiorhodospiraceae bacterium 2226]
MRARLISWALRALARLPLRAVHAVGAFGGWCLATFPNRQKRAARVNVDLCLPELPVVERRRLARRSLYETGKAGAEAAPLLLWEGARALELVREVRGEEHLQQAMDAGRGVLLAVPHLGCWEIVGLYCSPRYPMTSLYRSLKVPELEEVVRGGRERLGARLVTADARGVRAAAHALKRGELVAILPDQDPRRGAGVFVPFFGVPAKTMVLLPRLVHRTGAAVVFAYAERLPRGAGYRLCFTPPAVAIAPDADIEAAAAAMNRGVEACVRALPEQYQWGYKRFRSRPPGETDFYK